MLFVFLCFSSVKAYQDRFTFSKITDKDSFIVNLEQIKFKKATASDASVIADFCEKTFRDTYQDFNSAENISVYCAKHFGPDKQLTEILDPSRYLGLAFLENQIAGYFHLYAGAVDASVKGAYPVEILRFYVDRRWHGTGLAQKLIDQAVETSKNLRFKTIWLGVWDKNLRAISFYKKTGFTEVGSHIFDLGNDPQNDLIFVKHL
jgi:ribosomal protein S18 acetylase RimI-like enzyme